MRTSVYVFLILNITYIVSLNRWHFTVTCTVTVLLGGDFESSITAAVDSRCESIPGTASGPTADAWCPEWHRVRRIWRISTSFIIQLLTWNYEWKSIELLLMTTDIRLTCDVVMPRGRVADWSISDAVTHGCIADWLRPIWLTANW